MGESAHRRTGEWAKRRMGVSAKVTQDRWGEKLGAPRRWLTAKTAPRRF
jgi:hypothetical protein